MVIETFLHISNAGLSSVCIDWNTVNKRPKYFAKDHTWRHMTEDLSAIDAHLACNLEQKKYAMCGELTQLNVE